MTEKRDWRTAPFFAVGPGCYGYGDTKDQAVKHALKAVGGLTKRATPYLFYIYGPVLPEHKICLRDSGHISYMDKDENGNALPTVEVEERRVEGKT